MALGPNSWASAQIPNKGGSNSVADFWIDWVTTYLYWDQKRFSANLLSAEWCTYLRSWCCSLPLDQRYCNQRLNIGYRRKRYQSKVVDAEWLTWLLVWNLQSACWVRRRPNGSDSGMFLASVESATSCCKFRQDFARLRLAFEATPETDLITKSNIADDCWFFREICLPCLW